MHCGHCNRTRDYASCALHARGVSRVRACTASIIESAVTMPRAREIPWIDCFIKTCSNHGIVYFAGLLKTDLPEFVLYLLSGGKCMRNIYKIQHQELHSLHWIWLSAPVAAQQINMHSFDVKCRKFPVKNENYQRMLCISIQKLTNIKPHTI